MTALTTADTLASLVDEVIISLQGYGVEVDQIATLVASVGESSTQLRLDMPDAISRGIVEIGDEIIFISAAVNGLATVPAWGRGFKGTTAQAHDAGSAVYISPTYPRSIVTREVNNTIRAVYPALFAVRSYDFTTDAVHSQYAVPGDVDRIISVEWRWLKIDGWTPLSDWELVQGGNTTDFSSGKFLAIATPLGSGIKVHVTYAARPGLMYNSFDQYEATTGLPASSRDIVVYGAASRLLPWLDSGRIPTETVSADLQDQQKPVGNAVSVARELRKMYATRLQEERTALQNRYPMRSHRIR